MPDNFNDTLDTIKNLLEAADACELGGLAAVFYTQTATMNAVFQTEVLLVIADSLSRIADAMEAADNRGDLAESVTVWGTGQ